MLVNILRPVSKSSSSYLKSRIELSLKIYGGIASTSDAGRPPFCGFLGCPTTMNICSNCHGHLCLKKQTCVKSSISAVPLPSHPLN
ncbi:unnamed protein product [Brassica rapa subsp. trilocularis]